MFIQLEIFCRLDRGKYVTDSGNSQKRKSLSTSYSNTSKVFFAVRFIEQPQHAHTILIINSSNCIRVHDIVDPRDMLVADTFNAVSAKAVHQQRRALERF